MHKLNEGLQTEIVKYRCYDCNYRFEKKRLKGKAKRVELCPACGEYAALRSYDRKRTEITAEDIWG